MPEALYGLIGRTLGHSFSKKYFTEKFKREGITHHRYANFELDDIARFPDLVREHPNLRGLNVTIPYKEAIIPYLDQLDPMAGAVGAVNTIAFREGKLIGCNTDVFGFHEIVDPVVVSLRDKRSDVKLRALVLGSGGASRAVAFALREHGIRFRVISRSRERGDITWERLDRAVVGACRLIINTTPLGMHPNVDEAPPLAYEAITPRHVLIDLIYNPERTLFMKRGEERGARAISGMGMLHAQAEESWRIWNS